MPSVIYKPSSGTGYDFELKSTPIASKSDWGIDTLTAEMWGAQPGLVAYVAALAQGQTYTYNSQTWYLQSWSDDKDQVYPTVTLNFKGLFSGIPTPFVSGQSIVQTGTISCTSPEEASRTFSYDTRQTTTRYISTSRPVLPTYTTPDIPMTPSIFKSEIRTASGTIYLGNVPAALMTALTPGAATSVTTMTCTPIIAGTPLFECEDVCTVLLPSN
jgi:hypothetical protein